MSPAPDGLRPAVRRSLTGGNKPVAIQPCSNCGHIECKIDRRDRSDEPLLGIREHTSVGSRGVRIGRRASQKRRCEHWRKFEAFTAIQQKPGASGSLNCRINSGVVSRLVITAILRVRGSTCVECSP